MATTTDPARELADLAKTLTKSADQPGDKYLAATFGVEVWSTDFVKIIGCILERADLVAGIMSDSAVDDEDRGEAIRHLEGLKGAFVGEALRRPWNEAAHGLSRVGAHEGPIRFMSKTLREQVTYPRLSDQEVDELIARIDIYLDEIKTSEEPLFIRQAITDGLTAFRFQLDKIGWMGSGYALSTFRQLISIYDQSFHYYGSMDNPDPEAFLSGLLSILKHYKSKIDTATGWWNTADALFKGYRLASSFAPPLLLAAHAGLLPGR